MKKTVFLLAIVTLFMKLTHSQTYTMQYTNANGKIVNWGIMDKKEAVLDRRCSSGQKGGCFYTTIYQKLYIVIFRL